MHPVIRTSAARWRGVQNRLILASIQMTPSPLSADGRRAHRAFHSPDTASPLPARVPGAHAPLLRPTSIPHSRLAMGIESPEWRHNALAHYRLSATNLPDEPLFLGRVSHFRGAVQQQGYRTTASGNRALVQGPKQYTLLSWAATTRRP